MTTRREILAGLACLPCAAALQASTREPEIHSEPHALSEESASGYRLLLKGQTRPRILVAAGVRELSVERCLQWRNRVEKGAWLIFETGICFSTENGARRQAEILERIFAIRVHPPIHTSNRYIEYRLPEQLLVWSFGKFTPVECKPSKAIALCSGYVIGIRKAVGSGGIVYLGSMLGPGLISQEREAHTVGRRLISGGLLT